MCKPGWYWVSKGGVWRCAYWDGEDWAFGESLYDDAAWDKIGPRIPTPDEPWQLVPKYEPTEEMLFKAECEAKSKEVDMSSPTPTEHPDDGGGVAGAYYRGLLAAAPKPESQP